MKHRHNHEYLLIIVKCVIDLAQIGIYELMEAVVALLIIPSTVFMNSCSPGNALKWLTTLMNVD